MNVNDLTPTAEVFVHLHEMFLSAMQAGFTETQALVLCANIVTGANR